MTQLKKGDQAPDFSLEDGDGNTWRLSDLRGRKVLLYFYPADDTPGCTTQACDFRDSRDVFVDGGYLVFGVSPQGADSHQAFSHKYRLNFPLLIDETFAVAELYGAKRAKPGKWREVPLEVRRCTFVIDEEGVLDEALYDVSATGHVDLLRELLQGLSRHRANESEQPDTIA